VGGAWAGAQGGWRRQAASLPAAPAPLTAQQTQHSTAPAKLPLLGRVILPPTHTRSRVQPRVPGTPPLRAPRCGGGVPPPVPPACAPARSPGTPPHPRSSPPAPPPGLHPQHPSGTRVSGAARQLPHRACTHGPGTCASPPAPPGAPPPPSKGRAPQGCSVSGSHGRQHRRASHPTLPAKRDGVSVRCDADSFSLCWQCAMRCPPMPLPVTAARWQPAQQLPSQPPSQRRRAGSRPARAAVRTRGRLVQPRAKGGGQAREHAGQGVEHMHRQRGRHQPELQAVGRDHLQAPAAHTKGCVGGDGGFQPLAGTPWPPSLATRPTHHICLGRQPCSHAAVRSA